MNSLKDFFDRKNMGQTVLSILFAIYLIMGYETPDSLNEIIDSTYKEIKKICDQHLKLISLNYRQSIHYY